MGQEPTDPVIDEVREVRHRISARVGHDPARLVTYYIELQQQSRGRLIGTPDVEGAGTLPGTDPALTHGCGGPAARAAEPERQAAELRRSTHTVARSAALRRLLLDHRFEAG
jgi:hypothetical protein